MVEPIDVFKPFKDAASNAVRHTANAVGYVPEAKFPPIDKSQMRNDWKTIVVCGLLGHGKSTVINALLGSDSAKTSMSPSGCTQEPSIYLSEKN